jgi:two-component system phosphate regulon sensor histidine kinase PhoR
VAKERARRFDATVLLSSGGFASGIAGVGVALAVVAALTDGSGVAASRSLANVLLAAGLAGLAASVAVGLVLARLARRPLRAIGRFAEAVASGGLDRRVRWRGAGELGRVAESLDRMADETARRIAEANAEKEQIQAVLAGMVEGVLVVNAAGRIVLANPRLREMLSLWGEVAGRTPLEVIRHASVDDTLRAAAATRELVAREVQVGSGEGRTIRVHAVGFPSVGPRLGTVAVFHDITELRRLENLRRDFVANVSHELKTPLTAIRGFAETLVSAEVSPQDVGKYLSVILKHAERLGTLIDDLLELSRIESRKLPLRPAPVDVARIAASVVGGMEPQLRARAVSVTVAPSDAPLAWADRRAVEQILINLLDNAAKYTNAGGRIEVNVTGAAGRVRVEVRDEGIGIPKEDLPRVFERFYRVDKARSRDLGGTGLGLAIVKHLVQAMDGDIQVQSEVGVGSSFVFLIPAATSPAPTHGGSAAAADRA